MAERYILAVETEGEGGRRLTEIDSPIVDPDGRALSGTLPSRPLEPYEIREGVDVRTTAPGYLPVRGDGWYGDLLWYRVAGNLLLSDHAIEVLDAADLHFDDGLCRWPVLLIDKGSKSVVGTYKVLWATKRHRVLDRARSDIEYMVDGKTIRRVHRWAFVEDLTPNSDIFATEELRVVVSGRFRRVAEDSGLSGMKFLPVG